MIRVVFKLVQSARGITLRGRPSDRPHGWTNILTFRRDGVVHRMTHVSHRLGLKLDEMGRIILNG